MRFYSRRWHRKARAAGHRFAQASPEWKAQYQRDIRAGRRIPKTRQERPVKVTASIVDLLTLDRGWWTVEALAFRLNLKSGSVRTSLNRLEAKGQVELRRIPRVEWKAKV